MKKKISYIILLFIMLLPITSVLADGFSSSTTIKACGFDYMPSKLPNFTSGIYNILKLLIPVILIVMGMIDFTQAMMSSEEKKMKDSQKKFINRLIAGVVIFLIMAVVQFVFRKIGTTTSYKNGFVNCIDCVLNGSTGACGGGTNDLRKACSDYNYTSCKPKDDYGHSCITIKDNNGSLVCVVKGERCSDFSASDCPSTTSTGTHYCEVLNGTCTESCKGRSISTCTGRCKWTGGDPSSGTCVEK
ncbi:MAG: hypothetical protein E7157_03850 [Lactobacillales bacterium]|nr:hypothetical protein [Lactobacillales bacterium]